MARRSIGKDSQSERWSTRPPGWSLTSQQAGEEKDSAMELGVDKWTSLEIGLLNTTKQLRF